jgi:uncharacterized SAM-binding protein YcdF (DUF218 family)
MQKAKLAITQLLTHLGVLIFGIFVGLMILPFILAGELYEYQDTVDGVHLPPVDAIVCLAGGRGRIAAAGDLWYRYWERSHSDPPILYISGMGPQSTWPVLLRQLRAGVRQVIQSEDVILETESQNTESNAQLLAKFVQLKGWTRILLVTSPYHMRRATFIFDRTLKSLGLKVEIQTLSAFQEPFEAGEWRSNIHGIHVTLIEYIKWVYYRYFWKKA